MKATTQTPSTPEARPRPTMRERIVRLFKRTMPLITILAIVGAVYFYKEAQTLKADPQVQAQKEAQELVEKVGALIVLPEGEVPTVATVSDPEALKDQSFFENAQAGDKVLIFTTARKAILYSVTTNKIVNVAPLNIGNTNTPTIPKETPKSTTR